MRTELAKAMAQGAVDVVLVLKSEVMRGLWDAMDAGQVRPGMPQSELFSVVESILDENDRTAELAAEVSVNGTEDAGEEPPEAEQETASVRARRRKLEARIKLLERAVATGMPKACEECSLRGGEVETKLHKLLIAIREGMPFLSCSDHTMTGDRLEWCDGAEHYQDVAVRLLDEARTEHGELMGEVVHGGATG